MIVQNGNPFISSDTDVYHWSSLMQSSHYTTCVYFLKNNNSDTIEHEFNKLLIEILLSIRLSRV